MLLRLILAAVLLVGSTSGADLWKYSTSALIVAHGLDAASSWGRMEANQLLGSRFNGRALVLKSSLVASAVLVQHYATRKNPGLRNWLGWANVGSYLVVCTVAGRNWRVR